MPSLPEQNRIATEQEQFWAGAFGDDYTDRNAILPEQRCPFFRKVLNLTDGVQSICELGANRGHNLLALQAINPDLRLTGVELNAKAFGALACHAGIEAVQSSIQNFDPDSRFDCVMVCGVLIHLNPEDLPTVYRKMASLANRYVLINEYYNPTPVELRYRGHAGKLFKRDFGGEFMDANADRVRLVDYGFLWQRVEPAWNNTTWWLFEVAV